MTDETLDWFARLLETRLPVDGEKATVNGHVLHRQGSVLRDVALIKDEGQDQTRRTFAFKWKKTETYSSEVMRDATRVWLKERYGDLLPDAASDRRLSVLDIGCGGGHSASLLLEDDFPRIDYVGTDISEAVDVAHERLLAAGRNVAFVQADLMSLPFPPGRFDVVLSEGVLHHTPSTRKAIHASAAHVKPGGRYAIYVYAKKSPIREFTDDFLREKLVDLPSEEAWDRLIPLTRLGQALGELDIEVDVPEDVDLLGIPAGRIDIQRLFYWHICKMYHRPDWTLEEMNHVNFDWFTPRYAHRQTAEEVSRWVEETGLKVDRLKSEEAGHTVIATRPV